MNKLEIQDRLSVIDDELKGLYSVAEKESRKLDEAEDSKFKSLIEEKRDLKQQLNEINNPQNNKQMETNEKRFSILESVRNIVNHKNNDEFQTYLEETREMAGKSGISCMGQIQMRTNEARSLDGVLTGTNNFTSDTYNGGHEMVATDVLPLEQALYNNTVLAQAGARFFNGLVGDVKIPIIGKSSVFWEGENDLTESGTPTMSKVDLSPKRLACFVDISKQLLNQTSEDVEMVVKEMIAKAVAEKIESSILGDGTTPHNGVMYGASGIVKASLTYGDILDRETALQAANFNPTFVVDPMVANLLKTKATLSYSNQSVMYDGKIDGMPTFVTNNASVTSANPLICADFSQLVIGTWGNLVDITVDTVTRATYGEIRLVLNAYVDWGWKNASAYSVKKITAA